MSNTQKYFQAVTDYRAALTVAWSNYADKMAQIERYKGSSGFDDQARQYEEERNKTIKETQREFAARFDEILQSMRDHATSKTMKAPNAEQLALLQVLRMREHLERDELVQAGRTLRNCPAAVAVLDEIAAKSGYHGARIGGGESTASIVEHINTLADSARRLCKLDKPNSRREMMERASVHSPNHIPNALYSFQVDRDFSSERDLICNFGNVNDYESFSNCVNYGE